jgi:hypothetical protein
LEGDERVNAPLDFERSFSDGFANAYFLLKPIGSLLTDPRATWNVVEDLPPRWSRARRVANTAQDVASTHWAFAKLVLRCANNVCNELGSARTVPDAIVVVLDLV